MAKPTQPTVTVWECSGGFFRCTICGYRNWSRRVTSAHTTRVHPDDPMVVEYRRDMLAYHTARLSK